MTAHDASRTDAQVLLDELCGALREHVPGAAFVWLREEEGHDDPEHMHAHLHAVTGPDGDVLLSGAEKRYQDTDWSWDVDDVVFALHRAEPGSFVDAWPGDARRFRKVSLGG